MPQGLPQAPNCFALESMFCVYSMQDVVPEWQGAASALLTTLGISHAPAVLQELLKRFQPGTTPHYFVVKTTGDLAMANGVLYTFLYYYVAAPLL